MSTQFQPADAWLLLAAYLAAPDGSRVPLAAVIQTADGIQHAIPTKDEMDGAMSRLQRAGLIRLKDGTVDVLPLGKERVLRATHARRGLLEQQRELEVELGVVRRSVAYDPASARAGEPQIIPQDEWTRLMSPYRTNN